MDVEARGEPLLRFDRVTKIYPTSASRTVTALDETSFSVQGGEFVAVIGPSGSGKTTILRLAASLELPTRGQVRYSGELVTKPDRRRGLVFQSYNVFPWLTVGQNIGFGLQCPDSREAAEKISNWLEITRLTEFADSYPKILSGGMRQRLALARTMIVEPELLLLDEPFGALDERTREGMRALLLKAIVVTGSSVLFVTHDIREAIFLADRILLLSSRPGRILNTYPLTHPRARGRDFERSEDFHRLHEAILEQFPLQNDQPNK